MNASAQQAFRLHQATGLPVLAARDFLARQPAALCERILQAAASQQGTLHDPLEDSPEHGPLIVAVLARASAEVDPGIRLGRCHAIWGLTRRLLREEHGLQWFSPQELNPGSAFD